MRPLPAAVDKNVDYPNRIVLIDQVFQIFTKSFDELKEAFGERARNEGGRA